jgi:hypothetical protein
MTAARVSTKRNLGLRTADSCRRIATLAAAFAERAAHAYLCHSNSFCCLRFTNPADSRRNIGDFMSDGRKDYRLPVMLRQADRHFIDWMVYKYPCRNRATAVRTCIRMMAAHLGYDLDNDVPLVPPAHNSP